MCLNKYRIVVNYNLPRLLDSTSESCECFEDIEKEARGKETNCGVS